MKERSMWLWIDNTLCTRTTACVPPTHTHSGSTYIGELWHCVSFDGVIFLLQLFLDLCHTLRDVLVLSKQKTTTTGNNIIMLSTVFTKLLTSWTHHHVIGYCQKHSTQKFSKNGFISILIFYGYEVLVQQHKHDQSHFHNWINFLLFLIYT